MGQDTPSPVAEGRRFGISALIGVIVAIVLMPFLIWQLVALIGWIASAVSYLGWVVRDVRHIDAQATAETATVEDNSRTTARFLVVGASVASLGGVVFALARANDAPPALKAALTVTSLSTIIVSWTVVHATYMLRYAHAYYSEPEGGVDFPGEARPTYRDFAYLSFTVGMTFQVSDTEISDPATRRTLLAHAVISYLFGTVIVAVAINVVAGLV